MIYNYRTVTGYLPRHWICLNFQSVLDTITFVGCFEDDEAFRMMERAKKPMLTPEAGKG